MEPLEIVVQPCDTFRFRYESEGGAHGRLRGSLLDKKKDKDKNFPTVKLINKYDSNSKVEIKASLYTNEEPRRPHILQLVGRNCINGVCWETLSEDDTAVFRYLEIESKCKEEAINILMEEKTKLVGKKYKQETLKKEAQEKFKLLNMNCAVLCFEAFQKGSPISRKVFSTPIKNSRSTLKITRISRCAGSWEGGEEVILLCEKVKKGDIEIHFYEKNANDDVLWEKNGIFNPKADVHHQVAIVFKTPKYRDSGGPVFMELHRPSDKQRSKPLVFKYISAENDALRDSKKRKLDSYESIESDIGQASTSSEYGSSSPVSPMEAKSNLIESLQQDVSGNDSTFFENDCSMSDDEFIEYIETSHSGGGCKFLSLKDIINYLKNIESSIEMDAVEPNDSYPKQKFQEKITGNMECNNALQHPILPQSSPHICQSTLTSGRDQTFLGKIWTGLGYSGNIIPSREEPIDILHSSGIGDLNDLVLYGLESGMEKVVSYIKPSWDSKTVPKRGREDAATNYSFKPSGNEINAEGGLCFDMTHLSIGDDDKKVLHNASMELPITVDHQFSKSNTNAKGVENKRYKNPIEVNRNFEHFKESISCIMKNRDKAVYLRYISKLMSVTDEDGNTFLHLAVKEQTRNVNLIANILKICPDFVNQQNNFKETPVHLATKINAYKIVFLLLSKGGNPNIVDAKGNNCFHITSTFNLTNSMTMLLLSSLKYGKSMTSIDEINYEGWAPIHLAVLNNAKECLKLLLQANADVNIRDRKSGSSPINLAMKQQPSLVQDLLSHPHIDLLNEDFHGDTFIYVLSNMKGVPMPRFNQPTDLVNWAHKTLALNSIDAFEDSSASSDSDYSDKEVAMSSRECLGLDQPFLNDDVDQNSLNKECEERLRSYLDSGSHWRKLGSSIGFDEKKLDDLETLSKNSSPSKLILRKIKYLHKNCGKQTLVNILTVADMKEAVKILN